MNGRFFALGYLTIASVTALYGAATGTEWLLPNFANRLSVEIHNGGSSQLKALATLPIVRAQAVAPDFPGRLALAVLVDSSNSGQPATIIASQAVISGAFSLTRQAVQLGYSPRMGNRGGSPLKGPCELRVWHKHSARRP